MIGRTSSVEAVKNAGLFLDTSHFQKSVRVEASTELSAAHGPALVLFCVKTTDSAATARELAPFLAPDATLVSLQSGVDNVEQIRAAANIDALPAAVYVAASVQAPGRLKHDARGDLVIGLECEQTRNSQDSSSAPPFPAEFPATSRVNSGPSLFGIAL
jgi:2-dehydropantoate 2-reductase